MPAHKKQPEDIERRNQPADLATLPQSGMPIPRPPMGLSAGLRRSWDGLWSSPVARLLDPVSDLPVVARLFYLYKLSDRMARQIDHADPMRLNVLLEDSDPTEETRRMIAEIAAGIQTFNATVSTQIKIATEIRQIEQTIGVSPKARLGLGVALAGQNRSAIDDLMDDD